MGQKTLDSIMMPSNTAMGQSVSPGLVFSSGGGIGVRDVISRQIVAQFATANKEPVECMKWDSSGLLLISCTCMAHSILLHRVVSNSESITFSHVYTLSRGITPALISDICIIFSDLG